MKLLSRNTKMRKTTNKRLFNFGIPAFKSSTGFKTCPKASACVAGCYAKAGAYLFSNVAKAFERRLEFVRSSTDAEFISTLVTEIKKSKVEVLRVHDSGDFFSKEYALRWFKVAETLPNVQFYAYTKQVKLFKGLTLPANFIIIYSLGGTEDLSIDLKTDRHAKVFESEEELIAAGYVDAGNNDLIALGPETKIGLVYHGTKKYSNTTWNRTKKVA